MTKTSFVLHHDSLSIFDKLTDAQIGKLMRCMAKIRIDGEIPEMDFTTEILIEPFLNQFKRDDASYQKTIERNRTNGAKNAKNYDTQKIPNDTQQYPLGVTGIPIKPKRPYSDKDSVSGSDSKRDKVIVPPSEIEVADYFQENGYTRDAGIKAFRYYESANWKDSKGNKVKNWKQKMQGVWFKEENNIKKDIPASQFSGNQPAKDSSDLWERAYSKLQ